MAAAAAAGSATAAARAGQRAGAAAVAAKPASAGSFGLDLLRASPLEAATRHIEFAQLRTRFQEFAQNISGLSNIMQSFSLTNRKVLPYLLKNYVI